MNRSRKCLLAMFALATTLVACTAPLPSIRIDALPDAHGMLRGRVAGFDPSEHRVAAYIHVEGSGWWSKPETDARAVAIDGDGGFELRVVDGGLDEHATIFSLAVIARTEVPPIARGSLSIPRELDALAMDVRSHFRRRLRFAGREWGVKEAPLPVGPGSNLFSASHDSAFVDSRGRLHLAARRIGQRWFASEVVLLDELGHGSYSIQTECRLDRLDPSVTFGAFLWDPFGDEEAATRNPHREIDFEDTRWGDATDQTTSQFVVQPFDAPGHLTRYTLPDLGDDARITREFTWMPDHVHFVAARGLHPVQSIPRAAVIAEFEYREAPEAGCPVPSPGRVRFHMNVWLNATELGGQFPPAPPVDEVEVVILDFRFAPASGLPERG